MTTVGKRQVFVSQHCLLSGGRLDLTGFLPLISPRLLESFCHCGDTLTSSVKTLRSPNPTLGAFTVAAAAADAAVAVAD